MINTLNEQFAFTPPSYPDDIIEEDNRKGGYMVGGVWVSLSESSDDEISNHYTYVMMNSLTLLDLLKASRFPWEMIPLNTFSLPPPWTFQRMGREWRGNQNQNPTVTLDDRLLKLHSDVVQNLWFNHQMY